MSLLISFEVDGFGCVSAIGHENSERQVLIVLLVGHLASVLL